MKVNLLVNMGCVKGIASKTILNGIGNEVMSVNIMNIIGKTSNMDRGPTNACAPLTSSAKIEREIANAKAESIETKREAPRSKYDAGVGANPIAAKSTPVLKGKLPVKELV